MLGEKFNLEGGRGPYITHILTSKELRATQTAHEALEAMERIGIEVKEYAVLRGEPEGKNAKNHLREIIESLPRHKSDRIEVVVVTHRRFIDNILERCKCLIWNRLTRPFTVIE
jgi:phosphohistidine phosphatase SixA